MNNEVTPSNEDLASDLASTEEELEASVSMVGDLQDEVDSLQARVVELESTEADAAEDAAPAVAAAPAGDDELRALAATVRTAQRNGHPDAATHLDTLLNALGAL